MNEDQMGGFWLERFLSLADNATFYLLSAIVAGAFLKWGKKPFFPLLSLRTRVSIVIVLVSIFAATGLVVGLNPYLVLLACGVMALAGTQAALANVAGIGVLNAFSSTKTGITPEASLKLVNSEIQFLGIGGGKLTVSEEFMGALTRCASSGGEVRFLLSHPENPALEKLAKRNGRDDASYRSRVRESIREIINKAEMAGVSYEIRTYRLDNELALPHFRLMFIDNKFCLYSHLVWGAGEGWDNPQLFLSKETKDKADSLYLGYMVYFDDLWNSPAAELVTKDVLDSWPS
jgi:hypothetical protein